MAFPFDTKGPRLKLDTVNIVGSKMKCAIKRKRKNSYDGQPELYDGKMHMSIQRCSMCPCFEDLV